MVNNLEPQCSSKICMNPKVLVSSIDFDLIPFCLWCYSKSMSTNSLSISGDLYTKVTTSFGSGKYQNYYTLYHILESFCLSIFFFFTYLVRYLFAFYCLICNHNTLPYSTRILHHQPATPLTTGLYDKSPIPINDSQSDVKSSNPSKQIPPPIYPPLPRHGSCTHSIAIIMASYRCHLHIISPNGSFF